ncbi:DNA mismatch repair protein MutS, partial [Acinetobacter variabilis]
KQAEMKKSQAVEEEMEDTELFKKALTGVKPIDNGNIAQIKPKRVKKIDAQTLAKRAAAEGSAEQELTEISDTQAILNPVASQAALSY